ncbi:Small auxin-up RNA [Trema orientale]|uniref:Small auxin-up RNA n=1 Tax=Trema orientale TaxID=63057 RepID=A0A2P5FTP3_TREOI|nr:Small auxin-up RNA [Trema orientale]
MAKLLKMNSIANLRNVAEKLQKIRMSTLGRTKSNSVPEDVKEGHFAVIAVAGDEPKRFVVPLSCLAHPSFRRLLEQAAEEYGFDRNGALTVPCRPSELERILAEKWQEAAEGSSSNNATGRVNWGSCKTMVQSY